jgi:hypothetical protein
MTPVMVIEVYALSYTKIKGYKVITFVITKCVLLGKKKL